METNRYCRRIALRSAKRGEQAPANTRTSMHRVPAGHDKNAVISTRARVLRQEDFRHRLVLHGLTHKVRQRVRRQPPTLILCHATTWRAGPPDSHPARRTASTGCFIHCTKELRHAHSPSPPFPTPLPKNSPYPRPLPRPRPPLPTRGGKKFFYNFFLVNF